MTGLTRKQAAALVGVSEQTIVGWQSSGYLHQPYTAEKVLAAQQAVHVGDGIPRWRANPHHAGRRLRVLRERAGLNQQHLARQADLTHEEISRLEHGEKSPQAPTVHKLSQALGIELECFVDDSPIGLELLMTQEAGQRLDVPTARVRAWMKQGVMPGVKVGGEWRVPAIAVANSSAVAGCADGPGTSPPATGADLSRTPETLWEQSAKREGRVHLAPRLLSSIY